MAPRRGWLRYIAGLGLALLVLGQLGCRRADPHLAGVASAPEGVLRRSHSRFSEESCERTYLYEVQPVEGRLELCIRVALQTGAQSWQIIDPTTRQIRWDAEAVVGQPYRASHCFEAQPGIWEIHVGAVGATGEYEITWHQRAGQISSP